MMWTTSWSLSVNNANWDLSIIARRIGTIRLLQLLCTVDNAISP